MDRQNIIFATADGPSGDILLMRLAQGKAWFKLDGQPYMRKELNIKRVYNVDYGTLMNQMKEHKKEFDKNEHS